jgi:hypothetical protein
MRAFNRRAAGITAAAAAIGLASAGVAYAHGDFGGDGPRLLHGQFVVQNGHGGTLTQDVQTGVVTANSADAVTVKSSDGFTQTYDVTKRTKVRTDGHYGFGDDAATMLHNGDKVWVLAVERGSTPNALGISDVGGDHFKHGGHYYRYR